MWVGGGSTGVVPSVEMVQMCFVISDGEGSGGGGGFGS